MFLFSTSLIRSRGVAISWRCIFSARQFENSNFIFFENSPQPKQMSKRDITTFFSPKAKRTKVEKKQEEEEEEKETNILSISEERATETTENTENIEATGEIQSTSIANSTTTTSETTIVESQGPTREIVQKNVSRGQSSFDLGTWNEMLQEEFTKPYFRRLMEFVDREYSTATVFPPRDQIFTAFTTCDLDNLKVVIIGQDPYHGPNQVISFC